MRLDFKTVMAIVIIGGVAYGVYTGMFGDLLNNMGNAFGSGAKSAAQVDPDEN